MIETTNNVPSTKLPFEIAIQAQPPEDDQFLHGSFHELAVLEFFGVHPSDPMGALNHEKQLSCHRTHEELMAALASGAVHTAMVAVDNNNSGRVASAIEALRRSSTYKIIGKIAIEVNQYLLLHKSMQEKEVEQVISQRPALRQAEPASMEAGWERVEHHDTVASAWYVAKTGGQIEDSSGVLRPTAAIASKLAGIAAGLTVGRKLSEGGNATTFWLVSDQFGNQAELTGYPTNAAFTFTVPDHEGSLLEIVSRLSDAGFDLTDIDCHLAPSGENRAFFAEVKLSDLATLTDIYRIIADLKNTYRVELLGVYEDRTSPEVHTAMTRRQDTDLTTIHELWNGRSEEPVPENSPVIYVEATNAIGSLKGMLQVFHEKNINIVDMSRPYAPTGNGSRGFYFVLAPGTDTGAALDQLSVVQYRPQLCVHDGAKLDVV